MLIDSGNLEIGNDAMASVLLLYFHLLREGGITNDQTTYIALRFDGFDFLDVHVAEEGLDIDRQLIREGAVVSLLCDLKDIVSENEDHFLSEPYVKRLLTAHVHGRLAANPEVRSIVEMLQLGEAAFPHANFNAALADVFDRYVVARIRSMLPNTR